MKKQRRVDRVLELLDNATQESPEASYGTDFDRDLCARCQCEAHADESDFCEGCRSFLLGDTDVDPREVSAHGYARQNYLSLYTPITRRASAVSISWRPLNSEDWTTLTEFVDTFSMAVTGSLTPAVEAAVDAMQSLVNGFTFTADEPMIIDSVAIVDGAGDDANVIFEGSIAPRALHAGDALSFSVGPVTIIDGLSEIQGQIMDNVIYDEIREFE